ncbi:hypothetical protein C1I98_37945 [Spongiactinospora gelatinilytica]|uniref:Uncharacterized protein n=1 Tax=Spongiactinospora gelatinilytica TaxID=2666298 RepID=A0A2W2F3C3_9ACTN|nr:hypothetical protein [Spongiactinospora gelatinilytica]PZG19498.1 hypothetical protein C1I98_37945 [Spongiactinospora gelatinilytica]
MRRPRRASTQADDKHPFTAAPIGGACHFGIWILGAWLTGETRFHGHAGWMSVAITTILWGRTAQLANLRRQQ